MVGSISFQRKNIERWREKEGVKERDIEGEMGHERDKTTSGEAS